MQGWAAGRRAAARRGRNGHAGARGLQGGERLEHRALLAGLTAPLPGPETILRHGQPTEIRLDHWVGRLTGTAATAAGGWQAATDTFATTVARGRPAWQVTPLGNGFFGLVTPGASRAGVLAWAAHVPAVGMLEPDRAFHPAAVPLDPSFAAQWNLQNTGQYFGTIGVDIDAPRAWDITTGSRGVVVAVIDSGIDVSHPDLAANIWTNPGEVAGNVLDDDHNGFVDDVHGWNFVDNNADVSDGYGHGTHVAGIIGAVGNNRIGGTGVAWHVSLMALKVEDSRGVGYTSSVIAALNYVTMMRRDHGINIVVANASWESAAGFSTVVRDAIAAEGDAGVTFVAAAGNDASNNDLVPRYPSGYRLPNVITVAALDNADTLAGMSNYGAATVDLAAPGTMITSTLPGGVWGMMSGTSMAAPQVSGVVALLAAAKPGITVAEVRAAILGSTTPVADLVGKTVTGGRLDAFAALGRALAGSLSGPAPAPAPAPIPTPAPVPLPAPAQPPVSPPPSPVATASLPFTESFSQPDGAPAATWVPRGDSFTIVGNVAVPGAGSSAIMTVAGLAPTDVQLRASLDVTRGGGAGLVARADSQAGVAEGSLLVARVVRTRMRTYAVQLWREDHGSWRMLANRRVAAGAGELAFFLAGNRLTVAFNGRPLIVRREQQLVSAGAIGLQAWGAAQVKRFAAT